MSKEKTEDLNVLYILIAILVFIDITFIIGYSITAYIITRPTELNGKIECSSGKMGIDYESNYSKNMSQFVPIKFNIKGIDNLNCKAEFTGKGPITSLIPLMGGN